MKLVVSRLATGLIVGLLTAACGEHPIPPGPSGSTGGVELKRFVSGTVYDHLGRLVAQARVDVLDGPLVGTTAVTDAEGYFNFSGPGAGAITLKVSKAEYTSQTRTVEWGSFTSFQIDPALSVPLDPGSYTLSFALDLSTARGGNDAPCEGFPGDLATQSFQATVGSFDHYFDVLMTGPTLPYSTAGFKMSYSGQQVDFTFDPALDEVLSPGRFFRILAETLDRPVVSDQSGLVVPIKGGMEYCRTDPSGSVSDCFYSATPKRLEHYQCMTDSFTMVLRKR